MTVVLISPPLAKACEPLLGIATLKAVLETEGLRCHCIDANAEAQEWLLSTARLDAAVARLMASDPHDDSARRRTKSWPTLRNQVERLKRSLRSPDGYRDENHYRTAVTNLNRLMAIASAGHNAAEGSPVVASLTDYKDTRYCDMDSTSVAAYAKQPEQNLFYAYYAEGLIPRIRALNPTVIGLSLIFRNQLLCGVALAQMLREAFPEAHLTLGGELVSAWAPHLEETDLLSCADSILPYEGEIGLLALAQGTPLDDVPNLCWRDADGHYHRNPTQKLPHLNQIPAPDFSWAPWELYFAPEANRTPGDGARMLLEPMYLLSRGDQPGA